MRYIILIISIIVLISLLALFEKPAVNQYYKEQAPEVMIEEVEHPKEVKKNPKETYSQSDMDFLMDAYGVGGS